MKEADYERFPIKIKIASIEMGLNFQNRFLCKGSLSIALDAIYATIDNHGFAMFVLDLPTG